jgi:DNA-directed RNA polymerase specialized sigma24 family protein
VIEISSAPQQPEPSLSAWTTIQDPHAPEAVRQQAFEDLLHMSQGWWGRGTLLGFVRKVAFAITRRSLGRYHFSTDQIDWEALGVDALLLLYRRAETIERGPRAWLIGVISNLVKQEARANFRYLSAFEVVAWDSQPEHASVWAEKTEPHTINKTDVAALVQDLDPSLRAVALLIYQDQMSRPEICHELGISAVTLRKRIERMRRAFKTELSRNGATATAVGGQTSEVPIDQRPASTNMWSADHATATAEELAALHDAGNGFDISSEVAASPEREQHEYEAPLIRVHRATQVVPPVYIDDCLFVEATFNHNRRFEQILNVLAHRQAYGQISPDTPSHVPIQSRPYTACHRISRDAPVALDDSGEDFDLIVAIPQSQAYEPEPWRAGGGCETRHSCWKTWWRCSRWIRVSEPQPVQRQTADDWVIYVFRANDASSRSVRVPMVGMSSFSEVRPRALPLDLDILNGHADHLGNRRPLLSTFRAQVWIVTRNAKSISHSVQADSAKLRDDLQESASQTTANAFDRLWAARTRLSRPRFSGVGFDRRSLPLA